MDRQAKVHLEEAFRETLEEKEEKINVLQTQVRKKRETEGKREEGREGEGGRCRNGSLVEISEKGRGSI